MRDHPVFALADQLVERIAPHRPANATLWGISGHEHAWPDLSPAGVAAWSGFLAEVQAEVAALPPARSGWDATALEVIRTWVANEQQFIASGAPYRWLAHIATPFSHFPLLLTHLGRTTTEEQEALRGRLRRLPEALAQYQAALAHGLQIGERASVRQVQSCIDQGHRLQRTRMLDVVPGPEADEAHRAYAELTAWLETVYRPAADPSDGVGEARYLPAAEQFLHEPLDLDATYAWGWELVHRLHADLRQALEQAAPGCTLAAAVEGWRTDPSTTAPSAEAFLDQARTWQAQSLELLEGVLPVPPIARELRIERAARGLPPGGWYMPPSETGDRPGTVQYSFEDGPIPLFDQQSTACHEGFPGHHLQLAIQTTLTGHLTRLHRLAYHCVGFSEGWALYAERLVDEHDGYDNPVQRVGFLVNQIARACRVVLDIGLHTGRTIPLDVALPGGSTGVEPGASWTYDRAVAFLTEIGGLRREVSRSEITRYLGWPGQAISYSVGMRRLLELRTSYRARGGTLAGFHDRVLGSGTIGLGRLAQVVLGPDGSAS